MEIGRNNNDITNKIIEEEKASEKCIPQEIIIKDVSLARAYVPIQKYCNIYNPIESLHKGTSFPELYMPNTEEY